MASMYSAKVMEHFANPHNVGEIPDANGVGEVGNPKCGDIMRMYLKIENNVIVDVKFLTFGCGAAIATSSMATDLIKGKTIDEALKLTNKAVVEALEGLPPIKVHCSVLAEQAVKAALSDYYRRQGIDPEPSWVSSKRTATTARAAATDPRIMEACYWTMCPMAGFFFVEMGILYSILKNDIIEKRLLPFQKRRKYEKMQTCGDGMVKCMYCSVYFLWQFCGGVC